MILLCSPVGTVFGDLGQHFEDVHEEEGAYGDGCYLEVCDLVLEHVNLQEETQVHESEPNHVHHGEAIDEASECIERAVLGVAPTDRFLEELFRYLEEGGR